MVIAAVVVAAVAATVVVAVAATVVAVVAVDAAAVVAVAIRNKRSVCIRRALGGGVECPSFNSLVAATRDKSSLVGSMALSQSFHASRSPERNQ